MTGNQATDAYLKRCAVDDELRTVMDRVALTPKFGELIGTRLLPRPVFAEEPVIRAFAADLMAFLDLLVAFPDRVFGGDVAGFCAELGLDTERTKVMRMLTGKTDVYGRADAYFDGERFSLLELNLGSRNGGAETVQLCSALLGTAPFDDFARDHQLTYVDTAARIAAELRERTMHLTGGADPVVAIVDACGILAGFDHMMNSFREMLNSFGIEVLFADITQLRRGGGRLTLAGRPVDAVLRYFTEDEIVEDADTRRAAEMVFSAHEEGEVVVWTTLHSELYANKGCLHLMSDPRYRGAFTAEEAELVDRVLPWTRLLTGADADLLDRCRSERASLIVKPQTGFGGQGVVAGWQCTDAEWSEVLADCAADRYIVQRRVVPSVEPMMTPTGEVEDWVATWGVFFTPQGYGGALIRALPEAESAVLRQGTPRVTSVFAY